MRKAKELEKGRLHGDSKSSWCRPRRSSSRARPRWSIARTTAVARSRSCRGTCRSSACCRARARSRSPRRRHGASVVAVHSRLRRGLAQHRHASCPTSPSWRPTIDVGRAQAASDAPRPDCERRPTTPKPKRRWHGRSCASRSRVRRRRRLRTDSSLRPRSPQARERSPCYPVVANVSRRRGRRCRLRPVGGAGRARASCRRAPATPRGCGTSCGRRGSRTTGRPRSRSS